MNHSDVGRLWNSSADTWTRLAGAGYDVYRDYLNTPAFFEMLPSVAGLSGLDIGCGEGHNTRLLSQRCARVTAVDIAEVFIRHAKKAETVGSGRIAYHVASAVELPYAEATFDFATAFMSFMDIPEKDRVSAEAYRVIKPGGFLQLSISHPCFDTPHRRNLRDENKQTYAIEVGDYYRTREGEIDEWLFTAAPADVKHGLPKFKIPRFSRTLSYWLNLTVQTGFHLEQMEEPRPSDETVRRCPYVQDAQVVSYFLHMRLRKPDTGRRNEP